VVVYVNVMKPADYENLSPMVSGAYYHKSMGRTIPKAVMCSPDQLDIYAKMSYAQLKSSKEYSKTSKVVKAILKGGEVSNDPTILPYWHVKNSKSSYHGHFIIFKNEKGGKQQISLAKLSAGANVYAKTLEQKRSGEVVDKKDQVKEKTMEVWESSEGKKISAVFVALEGEKIKLRKKDGKTVHFALSLLSEKSQQRAKELAE